MKKIILSAILLLVAACGKPATTFIWFPSEDAKEAWKKANPNVRIYHEEKAMLEIEEVK